MPISRNISDKLKSSSWIRKMFEEGLQMKQKYGAENVFDLSLGNPVVEPPEEVRLAIKSVAMILARDSTAICLMQDCMTLGKK